MDLKFSEDRFSFTITATQEEREELREELGDPPHYYKDESMFLEFIEYYRCNGYLEEVRPEEVGALTSSLLFAEWTERDDQDNLLSVDKVYWHRDYQVRGYIDMLIEDGSITFHADGE